MDDISSIYFAISSILKEIGHILQYQHPRTFLRHQLNVYDLVLCYQNLDSLTLKVCFDVLDQLNVICLLRDVDISGNDLNDDHCDYIIELFLKQKEKLQLISLNISNNHMNSLHCKSISKLLRYCNSIISLNVSNNPISDNGSNLIFQALSRPLSSFFDSDSEEDDELDMFNSSLTSLDISNIDISNAAISSIVKCLKNNDTLCTLKLDMNQNLSYPGIRDISSSIQFHNKALQQLSLTSIALSIKSCESLFNILKSDSNRLNHLDLSWTSLTSSHLKMALMTFSYSSYLTTLNLNHNPQLGDIGIEYLYHGLEYHVINTEAMNTSDEIISSTDNNHHSLSWTCKNPPLKYLHIASCGITNMGYDYFVGILDMKIDSLRYCDFSNNPIGLNLLESQIDQLLVSKLHTLKLNECKLNSKLCKRLFEGLKEVNNLSAHLVELYLATNHIGNSIANSLHNLIISNNSLQVIDLGYNKLGNDFIENLQEIQDVRIQILNDKQLQENIALELHVNLIGNKCDPYAFFLPNRSKSKLVFCFHDTHHKQNSEVFAVDNEMKLFNKNYDIYKRYKYQTSL